MNKKFSTLVASLLLSSAFSVYAGNAKPMLATPTQVETRATSADVEEAVEVASKLPVIANDVTSKVFPGFTNNSRLFVAHYGDGSITRNDLFVFFDASTEVAQPAFGSYPVASGITPVNAPLYYWSFRNGELVDNAGHKFTANGVSSNFEVIPVISSVDAEAPTYWFVLGTRDNATGKIQYVDFSTGTPTRFGLVDQITSAAVFCSVETEYNENVLPSELNDVLGDNKGFNLSIYSKIDTEASIVDADKFNGTLKADDKVTSRNVAYTLKKGDKYLVFDTSKDKVTSDPNSIKGRFSEVSTIPTGAFSKFIVAKADNGSQETVVKVYDDSEGVYRLYISNTAETYALGVADYYATAPDMNVIDWAGVTLGDKNIVDLREFLTGQYYTIDYVKKNGTATADDAYKTGGRLAILNDKVDYVPAKGLYEKAPEAQWAVSGTVTEGVNNGKPYFNDEITLTNRENPSVSFKITQLRRDNGAFIATIADETPTDNTGIDTNDVIKITAVENHDKHDGYKVFNDEELKNTTWYLGQIRQAEASESDLNVYWAENYTTEGTHQIGATVDEANATKWNLAYVTKNTATPDYNNQKDSILIVSTLQDWNDEKSRIDSKQDTLVFFPYSFQNRSNGEFVEFNKAVNLGYYQCREYTTAEESVFDKGTLLDKDKNEWSDGDARFALKLKASVDGAEAYNYISLNKRTYNDYDATTADVKANVKAITSETTPDFYAENKVYQHNSVNLGTWKNMSMYREDANSLMFVKKVDAPEYRKLVAENGIDSVTIYRADNDKQVVYEKRDDKGSALLERPVSFLNIDNIAQYPEINSSLYVDSAYVNRGNNTRYQYLLGVEVKETRGYYCPLHGFVEGDSHPCTSHAQRVVYKQGRYLMNMIDTANVLAEELKVSIHNNPFINETTEGNTCAKLAFVDAIHVLTDSVDMTKSDTLYVINNADARDKYTAVPLSSDALNTVKFAFKYVDSNVNEDFKIQTLWKEYAPNTKEADRKTSEEGFLRWTNGCLVVENGYQAGDVFNMNEDETRTPTANEEISTSSVVVAGTNGAVVVKGAEGKNVIVSTILGKVVANEVVSSDNATIAAPAGVVVVSVDGESFKVVVK